jgi:hypothetical protein
MISVLVEGKVLNRSVMTIEMREGSKCEWIPHDDVALLSTAGDEPVLARIYERIYTFLVKVECLVVLVAKILNIMDVNEAI